MRPRVVICGSFRRDPTGLRRLFRELEATGCRVLSPISLNFDEAPFAKAPAEAALTIREIELFHLRAIRDADFIALHAPEGYIGRSAAYEIGYANALRKPVFSKTIPMDEMLATQVLSATSVYEILEELQLISF